MRGGAPVVIKIVPGVENGGNLEALAFLQAGEDRADADSFAAVVADRFDGSLCRVPGRNGSREHQDMLSGDHRRDVLAENQL